MEELSLAPKRILIMEDENPMALALQMKLKKVGYTVEIANNGEDGLAALGRAKVDLILTDLMMPKKDGFAVLQALKDQGNTTPVMVLTNLSQTEDEQRTRALGARAFFVKSNTSLAVIVEKVQEILR